MTPMVVLPLTKLKTETRVPISNPTDDCQSLGNVIELPSYSLNWKWKAKERKDLPNLRLSHVCEWDKKTGLKSLNQPLRSESNQAELAGCRLWTDSKKVIFALWSFTYTYDIIKNNNRCRFTEMFYYINNEILAFELTDKTTSCKTGSYNTERSLFYVIFTFFVSLCH